MRVRISSGVNLDNERESLLKQVREEERETHRVSVKEKQIHSLKLSCAQIQAQLEAQGLTGVKVRWRANATNQVFKQETDDGTG